MNIYFPIRIAIQERSTVRGDRSFFVVQGVEKKNSDFGPITRSSDILTIQTRYAIPFGVAALGLCGFLAKIIQ